MKNTIYVVVIALCLILAIVIFVKSRSKGPSGIDSIQAGEMVWVMCNNPDCKAIYQMEKKDYYLEIEEKTRKNPLASRLAINCKQCGEESAFRAYKCEKCGQFFFQGAVSGDLEDRCPECGYSQMEAERKARTGR